MEFYVKKFTRAEEKTIDLIKLWWYEKTDSEIGTMALTDYGYLVFNQADRPIAAVFLYPVMGASVALIGWPIANPNVFYQERRDALRYLTTIVEKEARNLNYSYLVSYAESKGAKALFKRLEYKNPESGIEMFAKDLRKA